MGVGVYVSHCLVEDDCHLREDAEWGDFVEVITGEFDTLIGQSEIRLFPILNPSEITGLDTSVCRLSASILCAHGTIAHRKRD